MKNSCSPHGVSSHQKPPEATRKPWIESALPLGGPVDFPRALLGPREYKKKKELEPSMQVSALPFLGLE